MTYYENIMKILKYDNEKLIEFYKEKGLEFDKNKSYFGIDVKSFALLEDKKIIGAISLSKYKNVNFIEALAIDKQYRNNGYGRLLIEKAITEMEKPIYTISKVDEFYLKNGFVYDNLDLIDMECKTCNEYKVICFPNVVVYK